MPNKQANTLLDALIAITHKCLKDLADEATEQLLQDLDARQQILGRLESCRSQGDASLWAQAMALDRFLLEQAAVVQDQIRQSLFKTRQSMKIGAYGQPANIFGSPYLDQTK